MSDLAVLVVATAVAYLPGSAVLWALRRRRPGPRRPLLVLALAPAVSVSVAGVLSVITAAPGLSYGPVGLLLVTVAIAAMPVAAHVRARRAPAAVAAPADRRTPDWPTLAAGGLMVATAIGFGFWSWLHGLGGLATLPQEHDMVIHAMQTAYITRSGHAAPWQLVPADVITGQPVSFYPAGFHLLAAATAGLTGDLVRSLNAMTVVFLAGVVCLGAAALAEVAARQLGLGARSGVLVGGFAALVMAGEYRPGYHLMHDGGILANAAALVMVPGVVAGLMWLPRLRRTAAVGVGLAAAGAVWAHPSAAVSIVLTGLLWWAGQLVSPIGRRWLRGLVVPLLVAGVVGTVLLVPAVGPGLVTAGRTGAFPPDLYAVSFRDALGNTFGFPFSGWIDPDNARSQAWVVLLLALGVATVLALRRGLGPVFAWAGWSVVVMAMWVSPGIGFEAPITGFYYNAMLRVWSHVALLAPVLAGLGVVLTADRVAVLGRRLVPVPARWTALAMIGVGFVGYATGPAVGYARVDEESVATRYRTPDFVRVGPDDQRAIAWLADRVRPGERVLNSPNDGSTYLYVERGVPVVNVYTLGLPGVPYSYRLLESFNTYPTDEAVRQQVRELNVRWVYVDSEAPRIGSNGSPEGWAGDQRVRAGPRAGRSRRAARPDRGVPVRHGHRLRAGPGGDGRPGHIARDGSRRGPVPGRLHRIAAGPDVRPGRDRDGHRGGGREPDHRLGGAGRRRPDAVGAPGLAGRGPDGKRRRSRRRQRHRGGRRHRRRSGRRRRRPAGRDLPDPAGAAGDFLLSANPEGFHHGQP